MKSEEVHMAALLLYIHGDTISNISSVLYNFKGTTSNMSNDC